MCRFGFVLRLPGHRLLLCHCPPGEVHPGGPRHPDQCLSLLLPDALCNAFAYLSQVSMTHVKLSLYSLSCCFLPHSLPQWKWHKQKLCDKLILCFSIDQHFHKQSSRECSALILHLWIAETESMIGFKSPVFTLHVVIKLSAYTDPQEWCLSVDSFCVFVPCRKLHI